MNKISKLGLLFVIVNAIIVIVIGYPDNFNWNGGMALAPIALINFPTTLFIMRLDKICGIPYPYALPALFIIFGGLQWYFIGWLISRILLKIKGKTN